MRQIVGAGLCSARWLSDDWAVGADAHIGPKSSTDSPEMIVKPLPPARAEQSPAPTERTPKAPLSGADSPYQGEMSRRDKRGRDAVCEAD